MSGPPGAKQLGFDQYGSIGPLKHLFPASLRRRLRWIQQYPDARRITADADSLRAFRRLSNPRSHPADRTPEAVRFASIGGAQILLRPGSTDPAVAWLALSIQPHLPTFPPRLIWDLGANIGVTMAHAAHLYPDARIVGVEPDPANAALARLNTQTWEDRCEVIEAAVWTHDGEVSFSSRKGAEAGAKVITGNGTVCVRALTLNTLLGMTGPPDFVKMDIEGAEHAVLTSHADWAEHVREVVVECHDGYTTSRCAADLVALGFTSNVRAQRLSVPTVRGIRAG